MSHFEINTKKEKDSSARIIYGLGAFFFAALIHLMQWNQFALEIIPLKFKQLSQIATSEELYRLGQICQKRKKTNCFQSTYWQSYLKNPSFEAPALELGEHYMKQKNYVEALRIYNFYFSKKGQNNEARFKMAIALSELKRFNEAKPHFQFALRKNQDSVTNPHYVRTFVHYLIQNRDYNFAKNLIAQTRKKSKTATYFLEKELQQIDSKLKTSS